MEVIRIIFYVVLAKVAWRDWKEQKIGNPDVMLLGVLGILRMFIESGNSFSEYFYGSMVISIPLLFLAVMFPGSFGGGDIKLMAAGGFFLGMERIVRAFVIAILFAGVYCLWKILVEKANKKTVFALGPFLCAGMVVASL